MSTSELSDPHKEVEIAVVAISCRAPSTTDPAYEAGTAHLEALKQHLWSGEDLATELSEEALREAGVPEGTLKDPHYVRRRAVLREIDAFDASFFGLNPREASVMDPQHRLFLECCWEALESAACDPARFFGPIGVFAGSSLNRHVIRQLAKSVPGTLEGYDLRLANSGDFLATRTSYKLGLTGPSLNLQTACSTSLVAVHLACQSLLAGECDLALAGGVSIMAPQNIGYLFQEGSIASPDGYCRPFDADAQGTISGNGVGVVVLKRLEDALRDRNIIRAVVRGSAVNNDGSDKIGFTAPSIEGQAAVIEEAMMAAEVEPDSIGYVEAHGTGTPLGDPIEIAALTQAYRTGTEERGYCGIGSIKGNLGHLDAAAGIFGLIKAALAVEEGEIPPTLHFKKPNPAINFEESPFYVADRLRPWPEDITPRRAAVSSFGIGGTNVHMVVEEPPQREYGSDSRREHVLILSAKTAGALEGISERMADYFESLIGSDAHHALADTAFTLQNGRSFFEHRRFLVATDPAQAAADLRTREPGKVFGRRSASLSQIVFLFPGQGSQYPDMGRDLYETEKVFRECFDQCSEILKPLIGQDLREEIFSHEGESKDPEEAKNRRERMGNRLRQTEFTQPALFALEYSLARLWMSWGIVPDAMIGHSLGEYVAACVAGVFELEDALRVVARRGASMQGSTPGAMLSIALPREALDQVVPPELTAPLALAAVNDYSSCVLSGNLEEIDTLEQALKEAGVEHRRLVVSHAFHSHHLADAAVRFAETLHDVRLSPPKIPVISNLNGDWLTVEDAVDPGYWIRHMLGTVRFAEGIERLLRQERSVFLEVGPGTTLATLARRQLTRTSEALIFSSLAPPSREHTGPQVHDGESIMTALGRLWSAGVEIDWPRLYEDEVRLPADLPTYAFERQKFPITADVGPATASPGAFIGTDAEAGSEVFRQDLTRWFYRPGWRRESSLRAYLGRKRSPTGQEKKWKIIDDGDDFSRSVSDCLRSTDEAPEHLLMLLLGNEEWDSGRLHRIKTAVVRRLQEKAGEPFTLHLVTRHGLTVLGTEEVDPGKALIRGLVKVLPQEHPEVRVLHWDLDDQISPEDLAELLSQDEPFGGPAPETVTALRGRYFWTPVHEPLRVDRLPPFPFRAQGVYLLTGGLGGIGLVIAEKIARSCEGARFALLGRNAADRAHQPGIAEKLRLLESLSGEVLPINCDVSDPAALQKVLDTIRQRWGQVHGVVHAAGSFDQQTLFELNQDATKRALSAKVLGTKSLEEALKSHEGLDFFVCFSSLSNLTGGIGTSDYVAANAFLDSFVENHEFSPGTRVLALNWDAWKDVGMALKSNQNRRLDEWLLHAISPEEGGKVFSLALASTESRIAVSTLPLEAALSKSNVLPMPVEKSDKHERPNLDTPYLAARNETETKILSIWEELLGVSGIGIHDSFLDLGGHSLLATQVLSRLRQVGDDISMKDFFADPTVAGIAAFLSAKEREQNEEAEIEEGFL